MWVFNAIKVIEPDFPLSEAEYEGIEVDENGRKTHRRQLK
jgi:hypothetical protein